MITVNVSVALSMFKCCKYFLRSQITDRKWAAFILRFSTLATLKNACHSPVHTFTDGGRAAVQSASLPNREQFEIQSILKSIILAYNTSAFNVILQNRLRIKK